MGTTSVIIGGTEYQLPPLNFRALKACFSSVQKLMKSTRPGKELDVEDSVLAMDAAVDIITAALQKNNPEMTKEAVEDQLLADEIQGLTTAITNLLRNSGLVKVSEAGNSSAVAGQDQGSPSTATSTKSSASSSQPGVKAEVGTE